MLKKYVLILAGGLLFSSSQAQTMQASQIEKAPSSKKAISLSDFQNASAKSGKGQLPTTQAAFDIQLTLNLDSAVNTVSSYAAVCFTGTEFWVSKWNVDSLYTLSPTGSLTSSFKVPGVGAAGSGVRALTFDGTSIYASTNSANIFKINPATKTLISTTPTALGFNVRSLTYDATANNNAGGFWVSNFTTDIVQIDLNGNVLATISAATHGLGAMYGTAFDNLTAGGPYLWVFDQGGGAASNLVRLQLPAGTQTFVIHDVLADVMPAAGLPPAGISGGVYIGSGLVPGENSIMGVVQATPDVLFSYELDDITQIADDAAIGATLWEPGFTVTPISQVSPVSFPTEVENNGANQINALSLQVEVSQGATVAYTGNGTATNIPPGGTATLAPTTNWTPSAIGTYNVFSSVNITSATDLNPANDTSSFELTVSDSVFARDNGVPTGSLGIGNGGGGTLGQYFTLVNADQLTSATFVLNGPTENDQTRVVVYDVVGGLPANIIGQSASYTFTAADTNGVILTLPVTSASGGALNLNAGTFFIGLEENTSNITLATSEFNWRPNVTGVLFGANPWTPNEGFNFFRVYLLRANFGPGTQSLNENAVAEEFSMMPNPANSIVTVFAASKINAVRVMDINGRQMMEIQANGLENSQTFNIDGLAKGVYMVQIETAEGQSGYSRLVKQ
jgi:hypothetical protein